MGFGNDKILDCTAFEESLSDYLERTLEPNAHKAMASHALLCPLCHGLLNDVKDAMAACQQLAEPRPSVSRLDARILASTMPDATINCREFEEHLTDYLDGFLPASVFHRWERHAVLCDECSDLPGMVVRSLAAIVNYKLDELVVPAGLHEKILAATLGTEHATEVTPSRLSQIAEWARGFRFPITVPQRAPVALMTMIAVLTFSQTVSADGTLSDAYAKSYQLARQTYQQGAQVLNEATGNESSTTNQEPVTGTTEVENR